MMRRGKTRVSNFGRVTSTSRFPATHCPCGAGLCWIKFGGYLEYYCPGINELFCSYRKRCDQLKSHEILHSRPHPYPVCPPPCGAGVCRLDTMQYGPNAGRKYFACQITKGKGACNFLLWHDDYLQYISATESRNTTVSDKSIAEEINNIIEALENGEMELDFLENNATEIGIVAPNEIFSEDNDGSSNSSPVPDTRSDIIVSRPLSIRKPNTGLHSSSPTSARSQEFFASADFDEEGWWW